MADRITLNGRLSYPELGAPKAVEEGQDKKFSCNMIIKKGSDDHKRAQEAVTACLLAKFGAPDRVPQDFRRPIRDSTTKNAVGYDDDTVFISFRAKEEYPPRLRDQFVRPIDPDKEVLGGDQRVLYSGCDALVVTKPYYYDWRGISKGVAFSLDAVQFIRDNTPFAATSDEDLGLEPVEGSMLSAADLGLDD